MTKAELVKGFVRDLENAKVTLPEGMRFYSDTGYWEKNPEGYVLDESYDPLTDVYTSTVEGRIACLDAITVKQLRSMNIPEGIMWDQLWTMWGRAGVFQQPPRVIVKGRQSYLRLRYNAYISCDKSAGFVVSKDLSGRSAHSSSDLDMKKAALLCKLLRRYPATCHTLFYSYMAQVLAEFPEFPFLLRYNPAILGDYLKTVEEEYSGGNPMPNSKKVKPYHVPMLVTNKKVEDEIKSVNLVCDDGAFARFSFGVDQVSLNVRQVDGEHIYSISFPAWESHHEWNWEDFSEEHLDGKSYTAFMQYRIAVLLLALSGVEFNSMMFFTRKNKRLRSCPVKDTVPTIKSISELYGKLYD